MERNEILAGLRKARGLSQQELAEEVGVTRQTIANWEKGLVVPSAENLLALGRVYGIPAEELLNGKEEKTEVSGEDSAAGAEPAESGEKARPKKSVPHKKMRLAIAVICFCAGVILWGELTHSRGGAQMFIEFVAALAVSGGLVYCIYKMVASYIKKKG